MKGMYLVNGMWGGAGSGILVVADNSQEARTIIEDVLTYIADGDCSSLEVTEFLD